MAALRAAVFPLSAKNRRGGHFLPPPSSARVNKFSPNLLNGLICEARTRAKQSLLRRS